MKVLIATVGCPHCGWVAQDTHAIETNGETLWHYQDGDTLRADHTVNRCPNCGGLVELDVLGEAG